MMRVGVFGASGYAGREAVRILGRHPEARLEFATGSGEGRIPHEEGLARGADAYLLALPHGISGAYAAKLRAGQPEAVVVDLSGDLRIPTAEGYRQWYGHDHPAPALLGEAPYGLSEVFADRIRAARVVANPGCYATSVLLPLLPLLKTAAWTPPTWWWTRRAGPPARGARRRRSCSSPRWRTTSPPTRPAACTATWARWRRWRSRSRASRCA